MVKSALWPKNHFKFYILKCKNFLIDFLDELGNFKQKTFYTLKCNFFLHFTATDPTPMCEKKFKLHSGVYP